MKEIKIFDNLGNIIGIAKVDYQDFAKVSKHVWHITGSSHVATYLSRIGSNRSRQAYMHRIVLDIPPNGLPKGQVVDHINRNTLDNRRSNLRVVDECINFSNRKPFVNNRNQSSPWRGVQWRGYPYFAKGTGRWLARCTVDRKEYHIGYFDKEMEAAWAAEYWRRENCPGYIPIDLNEYIT